MDALAAKLLGVYDVDGTHARNDVAAHEQVRKAEETPVIAGATTEATDASALTTSVATDDAMREDVKPTVTQESTAAAATDQHGATPALAADVTVTDATATTASTSRTATAGAVALRVRDRVPSVAASTLEQRLDALDHLLDEV
jgi:hypothetical protein